MKTAIIFTLLVFKYSTIIADPKPTVVVVLCDVSRSVSRLKLNEKSIGNQQINRLKELVNQIPDRFRIGSEIYYFQITSNANSTPLSAKPVKRNSVIEFNKITENKRVTAQLKTINNEIDRFSSISSSTESSCILTSISNAYRFLSKKRIQNGSSYNYRLILLSDMLEYCDSFTDFAINLESPTGLSLAKKNFEKINFNNINFSSQKIAVTLVSISSVMTEKELLQIQDFWDKIFVKMGYPEKVLISSTL